MNDERIVKEFIELTAVDSLSLGEREMADVIIGKLKYLGLTPVEDDANEKLGGSAGNILARWDGEDSLPAVLLSAHMDTVAPGIGKKAIIDEERQIIKSDGNAVLGADDAAGIAEILEAVRSVKESGKKHRTVEILFTVAEEIYTKGAAVFDYSKLKAKEAYCLDLSGNVGVAAHKAPTLISFKAKVIGKSAHAGFEPEKGINAIAILAEVIASVKQGHTDSVTTLNIGTIKGGEATNIVSAFAECEGEVRSFDHKRALSLINELGRVFKERAHNAGADAEFEFEIHLEAYDVSKDETVVRTFERASENIGIEPQLETTLGGADNHQFNKNNIKGLVLSCGMQKVHTTEEFIEIKDLKNAALLLEEIISV